MDRNSISKVTGWNVAIYVATWSNLKLSAVGRDEWSSDWRKQQATKHNVATNSALCPQLDKVALN